MQRQSTQKLINNTEIVFISRFEYEITAKNRIQKNEC